MLIVSRLTFAALAATFAAAAAPMIETRVYRGSCDGSAAVALGPDRFVAAHDDDNILRQFRLDRATDIAAARTDVARSLGIAKEADLEAAARLGARIFWIGSFANNDDGEARPARRRFFATRMAGDRIAVDGNAAAAASPALFAALLAAPQVARYGLADAATKAAKDPGALNIEGLAATPGRGLLIGLRNPLAGPRQRAIVVTLTNPDAVVDGRQAPVFGDAGDIALGGRGIRSLEFVAARRDYLIVAGAIDGARDFALFRWSGRFADKPARIRFDFGTLNPEALAVLPDGRLLILSDDGNEKSGGEKCKDLPAARRSFRALLVRLDRG